MDHQYARDQQLTERYFLGELSDAEAEAFEEHYFSCAECAKDVRLALAIMRSGVHAAEPVAAPVAPVIPIQPRRTRKIWLPYAAAAAIAVAVATPQLLRDRATTATVVPVLSLGEAVRGAATPQTAEIAKDGSADVSVIIPPDAAGERYELSTYRVERRKRKLVGTERVSKVSAATPVQLRIANAEPGTYELVIEGVRADGTRVLVETHTFNAIRKKEGETSHV